MRLKSVETTPNPNSIKLNFHDPLGKAITFTRENSDDSPDFVKQLLALDGIKSVFVCQDFITINRVPTAEWKTLLEAAVQVCGGNSEAGNSASISHARQTAEKEGQVSVLVQTFKGVPIQVKIQAPGEEMRKALPERFSQAAMQIQKETNADFLKERYWADWGVRYGAPEEIAEQVAEEITGTHDDLTLRQLVASALGHEAVVVKTLSLQEKEAAMSSTNWHTRLKIVQELGSEDEDLQLLKRALKDEQMQVRRFAAAGLGATGSGAAVEALCDALLNDPTVAVRRTAGDALSDIGDVSAEAQVCRALRDSNKLVRWRACRFLAEVGTDIAVPSLREATSDSEFEVRLEAEAAIERILQGTQGLAPAWKRIQEDSKSP